MERELTRRNGELEMSKALKKALFSQKKENT